MHALLAWLFHCYSKLGQINEMYKHDIIYIDVIGPNVIDGDVAIYRPKPSVKYNLAQIVKAK